MLHLIMQVISTCLSLTLKTLAMNKTLFLLTFAFLLFTTRTHAQSSSRKSDILSAGLGFGQDYGGFGANATVYLQKNIGIFGGVGYALAGTGYNVGIKLRQLPKHGTANIRPFLEAMYGYNAAIHVANDNSYDRIFYGPTVGLGIDIMGSGQKGYLSLAVLVPIRSTDVDVYVDELRNGYVNFKNSLLPITFSIGYKLVII